MPARGPAAQPELTAQASAGLLERAAAGSLAATMALGLALRSAGVWAWLPAAGLEFANLRHAHSHVGFFGALTFGWYLLERELGVPLAGRLVAGYATAVGLVTVGFAAMGYRAPTIALSALVAALWIWVGLLHWRARRGLAPSWLDVAPVGLGGGAALIPLIAVMAKRDFPLSRELAHAFIAAVLFTLFVPAAFQRLGLRRTTPVLVWGLLAFGAAARSVFTDRAGLVGGLLACCFAALVTLEVWRTRLGALQRVVWLAIPAAVLFGGFVPAAQAPHVRLGGLHLLLLGPVVPSLFGAWRRLAAGWRWAYAASLGLMTAAVLLGPALWPDVAPAVAFTASVVFAAVALAGLGAALWRGEDGAGR